MFFKDVPCFLTQNLEEFGSINSMKISLIIQKEFYLKKDIE
jgi:hypothetical protein